ncbi:MAG: IclR family transcriptional regulator [Candidatus Dormibacteria bacterium]
MPSVQRNFASRPESPSGALDRVLNVLESVMQLGSDGTLAEIANAADAPKSSAHRVLGGLVRRGYVTAREHGHYGPGPQVFVLAGMANAIRDYAVIASAALADLRRYTSDTIHLALLVGQTAVYVEKLDGTRPYRSVSKVGLPLHLHSTAMGKAILAALPDPDREKLVERLPLTQRTSRTLTNVAALRRELELVRSRHFAIDDEENEEFIRCVGAAFRDHNNSVVGAVSVSAPSFLMTLDQALALAPHVLVAADALSAELGAPPASARLDGPAVRMPVEAR